MNEKIIEKLDGSAITTVVIRPVLEMRLEMIFGVEIVMALESGM